jgi:hypothetical protein
MHADTVARDFVAMAKVEKVTMHQAPVLFRTAPSYANEQSGQKTRGRRQKEKAARRTAFLWLRKAFGAGPSGSRFVAAVHCNSAFYVCGICIAPPDEFAVALHLHRGPAARRHFIAGDRDRFRIIGARNHLHAEHSPIGIEKPDEVRERHAISSPNC